MNSSIPCLIVDDEPLARSILESHIQQIPQLQLVASCQHAVEAFSIVKEEKIDLIFLDIQMPLLTGMEFVRSLQHPPAIIFTTAYRDYAVESYELDVIDYLLKPISFKRFFQAVNKYLNRNIQTPTSHTLSQDSPQVPLDHLFVNANKKHVKVAFADILYVESLKDYIRIHTVNRSIITKDKVSAFAEKLPQHFLRIHRSYIVNIQKLTAFTAHDVEIEEKEIPIGNSYKQHVLEKLRQ